MRSTIVFLCVGLAVANAAVIPLGYTFAPKIPVTTTIPVVTNVPITVPSCGCGVEVASLPCGCGYAPTCACGSIMPSCSCGACGCGCGVELSTLSCGCDSSCELCVSRSACLSCDPVTQCGCKIPLPVIDVLPSYNLGVSPFGCGCGRLGPFGFCRQCGNVVITPPFL